VAECEVAGLQGAAEVADDPGVAFQPVAPDGQAVGDQGGVLPAVRAGPPLDDPVDLVGVELPDGELDAEPLFLTVIIGELSSGGVDEGVDLFINDHDERASEVLA